MSMPDDIRQYLIDNGVSITIYTDFIADKPDTCIRLMQYAGQAYDEQAKIERPGLQILSRSDDYETSISNLDLVCDLLSKIGNEQHEELSSGVEINDHHYFRLAKAQSSFSLGKDSNGRRQNVQNFYVNRRKLSG